MSNHHKWLHLQIGHWIRDGLIDEPLAQALRQRHPLPNRSSWSRLVLSSLGAIIFGLGVILLFAYNWEAMPRSLKLGLVFGALGAAHIGGLLLRRPGRALVASEGLHALGTMLFGAAIWLVAQVYHIEEHYPNAFLVWGLGALALAWALPSATQGLIAVALVLAWQAMEVFDFDNTLHTSPWLILLAAFPLFWHLRSPVLGGAATIALLCSLGFATAELDEELAVSVLIFIAGAAVALGRFISGHRDPELAHCGPALSFPAHLVYLFALYLLSFPAVSNGLFDPHLDKPLVAAYFYGSLALSAVFWALALLSPRLQGRPAAWRLSDPLILPGLGCVAAFSIMGLDGGGWITAAPFNLLLLAHGIALIVQGSRESRSGRMVAGCLLIALLAVARYVDLFDSLLMRSLVFFIIGGLLFAAGNIYNRRRRGQVEGTP